MPLYFEVVSFVCNFTKGGQTFQNGLKIKIKKEILYSEGRTLCDNICTLHNIVLNWNKEIQ